MSFRDRRIESERNSKLDCADPENHPFMAEAFDNATATLIDNHQVLTQTVGLYQIDGEDGVYFTTRNEIVEALEDELNEELLDLYETEMYQQYLAVKDL